MNKLTPPQVRILATIKLYTEKSNPKPPKITFRLIQKELKDLKQGTISTTLHALEHKYGFIVGVNMHDNERILYANKNAHGITKKYFITALGTKTINRYLYLQIVKRDGNNVDYEKLSSAAYAVIRTPER